MSTEQTTEWVGLSFHMGDRMRKALDASGLTVSDMADYLGVHRNSVSAWLHLRVIPGKQTMRLWAIRTGVPLEWLETAATPAGGPGGGQAGVDVSLRARRDSNPQPSGWELAA